MKTVSLILLLLSSNGLFAQSESYIGTDAEEDQLTQEENEQLSEDVQKPTKKSDKEVISVECKCPENNKQEQEQEAESAVNSLFPPDSVFFITPDTGLNSAPPVQQMETERKDLIPGYIDKLPRGYSDDSYKQIPQE